MRLTNLKYIAPVLLAAAFLASCSGDDIVQNGQGNNNNNNPAGIVFEGENATPAHNNPATRTTATHVMGQGAKVFWEATDEIWVKDDAGTFQKSTSTTFENPANMAKAIFSFTTGSITGASHQVVYTGKGSTSATEVEIKAVQNLSGPNSFAHLGESGDCGVATATGSGGKYGFNLVHKASYLCLYPRIQGNEALRANLQLKKIVISTTDGSPIAGKYSFSATGLGSAPTSAAGSSITLNIPAATMPATTSQNDCYYAVIAPGTHHLKVDYYLSDTTTPLPTGAVPSAIISKDLGTIPCNVGEITDVSAYVNKDIKDYSSIHYYQWDAPTDYQSGGAYNPTIYTTVTDNYARQPHFANIPNANEMSWYIMKGDPHWDDVNVWSNNGHLYKGGMWFKKMNKIIDDNPTAIADVKTAAGVSTGAEAVRARGIETGGTYADFLAVPNFAQNYTIPLISSTPIPTADASKYFFLPAFGVYVSGVLYNIGNYGYYWSSSACIDSYSPSASSYFMFFSNYSLDLSNGSRSDGYSVRAFE